MPTDKIAAQLLCFAGRSSVYDQDTVCDRSHEEIAPRCHCNVGTMTVAAKTRKIQQPPFFEGFFVLAPNAQFDETPGRENDNRLGAAQENVQTFPFDRRMKTADNGDPSIRKFFDEITSLRDNFRRAVSRAEDRQLSLVENCQVPHRRNRVGSIVCQMASPRVRIPWIAFVNARDIHGSGRRIDAMFSSGVFYSRKTEKRAKITGLIIAR